MTRRAVLSGLAVAAATGVARGGTKELRVASLDWTLTSACLSLGVVPVGVAEIRQYGRWVVEPALPQGVVELGLREAPSLEGLASLAPDLILVNGFASAIAPQLNRIAPTLSVDIYGDDRRPLALAEDGLRTLARRLGREAQAGEVLTAAAAGFDRARGRLGASRSAPLLVFNVADARNVWIYGKGSLFADSLARIGLESAWSGTTSPWGSATSDITAVAAVPDATLVLVGPVTAQTEEALARSELWQGLTATRKLLRLPAVWPYGEVSAAVRFADLISRALARSEGSPPP